MALSADFRGALAENYVMQALTAQDLKTYYWMPTGKVGQGEIDFVFQDPSAKIIPIEVKSGRNVKAKTFQKFLRDGHATKAYRLSEANFGIEPVPGTKAVLHCLPLYAAFCIGSQGD